MGKLEMLSLRLFFFLFITGLEAAFTPREYSSGPAGTSITSAKARYRFELCAFIKYHSIKNSLEIKKTIIFKPSAICCSRQIAFLHLQLL